MTRPILTRASLPLAAAAALLALPAAGVASGTDTAGPTVPTIQVAQASTFTAWPEDRVVPAAADMIGIPVYDSEGMRVGEVFEGMPAEGGNGLAQVAVEMDEAVAEADEEPVVFEDATLVLHDGDPAVQLGRTIEEVL
jgi:hypothetical protein